MIESLDYFAMLVQDDDSIPLFEAALMIAQGADPQLDIGAIEVEMDAFASTLRKRLSPDASHVHKLRMLNHFFYRELGFGGNINDYHNAENSYLHRVIHTRRGIPVSLAIVYMELAHQVGLNIKGVSFPGHFLMKLSIQSGDIILDPFNGMSLSREKLEERLAPYHDQYGYPPGVPLSIYLKSTPPREILARMLRNLKTLFIEEQRWYRLLDTQQRLVILLPDEIGERRDRGLAYAQLDNPQEALQDLEAYLAEMPDAVDSAIVSSKLPSLREACRRH